MISEETLTAHDEDLVAKRARLLQELNDIEGKLAMHDPPQQPAQNGQSADASEANRPIGGAETMRHVLISRVHKGRMFHIRAVSSLQGWGGTVAVHGSLGTITGFQPFEPARTFRSKAEMVSAFTAATNQWIDRQLADESVSLCGSCERRLDSGHSDQLAGPA